MRRFHLRRVSMSVSFRRVASDERDRARQRLRIAYGHRLACRQSQGEGVVKGLPLPRRVGLLEPPVAESLAQLAGHPDAQLLVERLEHETARSRGGLRSAEQ